MKKLSLIAALLMAVTLPAQAEFPKNWYLEGVGDFLDGDILSTAIEADGSLSLGLDIHPLLNLPRGVILDAEITGKQLLVGTANPAGVYKIDLSGSKPQANSILERSQGVVSAVLQQKNGDTLAALSPFGQLYRITGDKTELIHSLEERYIWEMQNGPQGEVFILTGDKGSLYRLGQDNKLSKLYQSSEANLKVMHQDSHWGLLIGSGSKGIVYRYKSVGKVEALLDTPFTEITAMTGDGKGNVFVATTSVRPEKNGPKSAIYMINKQGQSEVLFRMSSETAFTLGLDKQGSLLIGTGPRGRIYRFTDPLLPEKRMLSLPGRSQSRQLTKLIQGPDNEILLVGSSPAQIESYRGTYLSKGSYESQIFNSRLTAQWGMLRFDTVLPPNTEVKAWSRSGNTAEPDATWSTWSAAYARPQGSQITSPNGKYLQFRFELSTRNNKVTPYLHSFDISYLRENLPPYMKDVFFLQRGLYFKPHTLGKVEGPRTIELSPELLDKLRRPRGTEEIYQELVDQKSSSAMRMLQEFRPGMLSLAWDAEDPNDDELSYEVWYQPYGQKEWKKLAQDLNLPVYSFDTSTLIDGAYHFRVFANDKISNSGPGFRVFKDSSLITIDNTPAVISNLETSIDDKHLNLRFSAKDSTSPLAYAEYSLNGQNTVLFQAKDGIVDGLEENFELKIPKPGKGTHFVVVRIVDRLGNVQTTKKIFEIR
jgi:hypothetical protein